MSEQLGESLSALMDGEATDQELEQVLDGLSDKDLRETWARYHNASSSLAPGSGGAAIDIGLADRICAAIAEEPALSMVTEAAPGEAPRTIEPVARWQRFSRPMASFAVAASVFAAVLVGTQFYGTLQTGPGADAAATERLASGGVVGALGGAAVRTDFVDSAEAPYAERLDTPASQPVSDYNAIARDRLQRYLLPHAEEAALNGNQGMMPFAKVATFEIEE